MTDWRDIPMRMINWKQVRGYHDQHPRHPQWRIAHD